MGKAVTPLTWVFAVVFLLVGVLGFFMTTDGLLLGIFEVDTTHNIIHIASGLVALVCAMMGYAAARGYLILFGIVYGLVTLLGFLNGGDIVGLITTNAADNYLHLAITIVTLVVGFASPSQMEG